MGADTPAGSHEIHPTEPVSIRQRLAQSGASSLKTRINRRQATAASPWNCSWATSADVPITPGRTGGRLDAGNHGTVPPWMRVSSPIQSRSASGVALTRDKTLLEGGQSPRRVFRRNRGTMNRAQPSGGGCRLWEKSGSAAIRRRFPLRQPVTTCGRGAVVNCWLRTLARRARAGACGRPPVRQQKTGRRPWPAGCQRSQTTE